MSTASIVSWQRWLRGVALALSSLAPCAAASAQLPTGSYLLQDPTRGILGIATASPAPGGGHLLEVEWIGPLGGVQYVALWYDPNQGFYVGQMHEEYYFHTYVQNGVAHYSLSRQTLDGDIAIVTSGTIG